MYKKLTCLSLFMFTQTILYASQQPTGPETLQELALKNMSKTLKNDCSESSCPDPDGFLTNFTNVFDPLDKLNQQQFFINENFFPALKHLLWQQKALEQFINNPNNKELNKKITKAIQNRAYQDPQYQIVPQNITNTFSIKLQVKFSQATLEKLKSMPLDIDTYYIQSKNIVLLQNDLFSFIKFYKVNFTGNKPHLLYEGLISKGPLNLDIDSKSMVLINREGLLISFIISPYSIKKDVEIRLPEPDLQPHLTPSFLILENDTKASFYPRDKETGAINLKESIYTLEVSEDPDSEDTFLYFFITKNNKFIICAAESYLEDTQILKVFILQVDENKSIKLYHTLSIEMPLGDEELTADETADELDKKLIPLLKTSINKEFTTFYPEPFPAYLNDNGKELDVIASFSFEHPLNSTNIVLETKLAEKRKNGKTFFEILKDLLKKYAPMAIK